ncbi:hypothetical protein N7G274_010365 [Stereocaulon virgatum]|uniref:Pre-rRNA-processing protein RIX1 n=1 Tax=Stereocaulon virgatum TaxID=373712 RepID=A0ABR3ZUX8_9LECA
MAPNTATKVSTPLRVVTQRISNTPTNQLPHVAPVLAATITECRTAFNTPQNVIQRNDTSDNAVLVHKLKTQISALLQDKQPHARYAAVVLIKATVEVGGWNLLQGVSPLVRGLIGVIGRPDPLSTKKLCIITLTRIFLLSHEHQSLVREITTPTLAAFVTACLKLVQENRYQDSLFFVILQALSELIMLHPTSFRPFVPQLQKMAVSLLAPTPSTLGYENNSKPIDTPLSDSSRRLFVLLHVCAPKNTAGEEWRKSLQTVLAATHRTADRVFRAVIEDWRPSAEYRTMQSIPASETVSDPKPEPLTLPSWTGIYAGIERLDGLLRTIQAFVASTTSAPVAMPVNDIMSLVDRILSALRPSSIRTSRNRPEIGRDEREGLAVGLPQLHVSALRILSLLISRLGTGFAALTNTTLEQIFWVLEDEQEADDIRFATYKVVSQILSAFGPSLPKLSAASLSRCVSLACTDLLPSDESPTQNDQASTPNGAKISVSNTTSTNADSYLKAVELRPKVLNAQPCILVAARELLIFALTRSPNGYLSSAVRNQIDRTAILTSNKDIMLASVMNTAERKKGRMNAVSILPLLARGYPEALEVETLLRPQLPIVKSQLNRVEITRSDEDEDPYTNDDHPSRNQNGFRSSESGFGGILNAETTTADSEIEIGQNLIESERFRNTVIATQPPLLTENPPTDLPVPKLLVSYVSSKRDREDDMNSAVQTGGSDIATLGNAGSTEPGNLSKRIRLTDDQLPLVDEPVSATEAQAMEAAVPQSSMSEAIGATGAQFDIEEGNSVGSDFEMPPLYIASDIDDDDDEDEDEGGD